MTRQSPPILITGFMGAGKSTIAVALANSLACSMIDLDLLIQEREGRSVTAIIDESGEDYFRQAETEALGAALEKRRAGVVALGGGTWTLARNRELIAVHQGLTIWLDAPFELCWKRISLTGGVRPLARGRESALKLFHARRAVYEQAPLRVQVNEESSIEEIVAEITGLLPH